MSDLLYGIFCGAGMASLIWGTLYALDRRDLRDLQSRIDRLTSISRNWP